MDQSYPAEHGEVFGHGLAGHGEALAEGGRRSAVPGEQQVQHLPACRVPDRRPQLVVDGHAAHRVAAMAA
jgi:hypothetical protein